MNNYELRSGTQSDHLKWLAEALPQGVRGSRVLDVGCGSLTVCEQMAELGASLAVGCDVVPPSVGPQHKNVRVARTDFNDHAWRHQVIADAGSDTKFDLALMFDIIEHVQAPGLLLEQVGSLLIPGATLIVTTPNTDSWERRLRPDHWSGSIDDQHRILFSRYSLQFLEDRSGYTTKGLRAPIRALRGFAAVGPQWGGQILLNATRVIATRD